MPRSLADVAQDGDEITPEMVGAAAKIAGLSFAPEQLREIAEAVGGMNREYERYRDAALGNDTPLALVFNPVPPGFEIPRQQLPVARSRVSLTTPASDEELALLSVIQLAHLIETRQVTSTELTRLYLARLKQHGARLLCVVSLTEELALRQAAAADEEIAAGNYRGPLHGVPYGLKDLLSVRGYRTTWGASPYRDQVIDVDATVYERLSNAGAVLLAKLTSGALASGADWYGGTTRNPWNPQQNSFGSSAGPAAATAAGLVGFAIGTETAGSITSPASACGIAGLRPSYGRVSRHGVMALSWSLDKIGPMCRTAEDCAIVFDAIVGPDGRDNSVIDVPFNWDGSADISDMRIGVWEGGVFERENPVHGNHELPESLQRRAEEMDRRAIDQLRAMGAEIVPFELPEMPARLFPVLFQAESAAAFDELMRSNRVDMMRGEPETSGYPGSLRSGRFVPAVEYLQANRLRTRLMQELHEAMAEVDIFVGSEVYLTNITGYPELSVPSGFYDEGPPTTLRLTGTLFGEQDILKVAHAFQSRTTHHLQRPEMN